MDHFTVSSPFVWQPAPADAPAKQADITNDSPKSLSGLGIAVKDLFAISNVPTTAGNPDWLNSHATPHSTASAVTKLLAAGAQVAGKTITDELAYSLNGKISITVPRKTH